MLKLVNRVKIFTTAMIVALVSLTSFSAPVFADGDDSTEVTNNGGMGNVSIAILSEQYDPDTKKNVPWDDTRIVLPGDKVSEIVTIVNEGEPAWIRAKLDFETKAVVNFKEDDVTFMDGWIRKKDGYWYWPKEVKPGEKVQFMDAVSVPADWSSEQVKKTEFTARIHADAVQTRHFTPDFKSDDPWFGTVIEVSQYNYTREPHGGNAKFSITYEGGAEGLVRVGDDFFSNWDTLMPGDHLEDQVVIRNTYSRKLKMYFRSENAQTTELEENIKLKIYRGNETIFDGTLAQAKEEMVLAVMDPDSEFIFKYEIDIPKELNNKFDLTDAQVKWIFRVELLGSYIKNRRQTGVNNDLMPYYIAAAGSVAVLAGLAIFLKKKKKNGRAS